MGLDIRRRLEFDPQVIRAGEANMFLSRFIRTGLIVFPGTVTSSL